MAKSEEKNKDFFLKVYGVVRHIPAGKVTTYGLIAQKLGLKLSARMVGWALNSVAGDSTLACHRVVNRNGELTGKMHFVTPTLMRDLLEAEGINFIDDAVDMKKHLWNP